MSLLKKSTDGLSHSMMLP